MSGLVATAALPALGVVVAGRGTPAPADVKAGWTALVVFVALAVAVVFLYRSLKKQLGRVTFEEAPDPRARREDAGDASGDGPEQVSDDAVERPGGSTADLDDASRLTAEPGPDEEPRPPR